LKNNKFIDLFVFEQTPAKQIEESLELSPIERRNLEKECADEIKRIRLVRPKYYTRQDCFESFKDFYYNWYVKQKQQCKYCEITQEDLHKLFPKVLPIKSMEEKKLNYKRKYGTLEIEKRDSTKPYCRDNMVLACPLCNNAKSNLIDEDSWKKIFVKPIQEYYAKCLKELDYGYTN